MSTPAHKKPGWVQRFLRWLFGAPLQELPPEFGDTVPPELRVFEAETEEAQQRLEGDAPQPSPAHHKQSKPVRPDEFLEH